MSLIVRFLLSGVAVMLTAYLLPGVHVKDYWAALLVAALISIVNVIVKPILIVFTIPITVVTPWTVSACHQRVNDFVG